MPFLQDGLAWLNEQMGQAAGVAITYRRGVDFLSFTADANAAWVGQTRFASNQMDGPRVEFGERDYLIVASFLANLGWFDEPREGDRIEETINGETVVFEIALPDTGEPAWRWSDPGQTRYRIHVKKV